MAINYYPQEGQCLSCSFYDKFHCWSQIIQQTHEIKTQLYL